MEDEIRVHASERSQLRDEKDSLLHNESILVQQLKNANDDLQTQSKVIVAVKSENEALIRRVQN